MCAKISNAYELIRNEISQNRPSLQRLHEQLFPTTQDGEFHPKPSTLIEISGNNESGKSTLLQYILQLCILPKEFDGKQSRVILIDLKNKFDAERFLCQVRESIIKRRVEIEDTIIDSKVTAEEITQLALDCLKSVMIFYAYSSKELAFALDDIEEELMEDENGDIALLAIDGLDSFYWIDNFEQKQSMHAHYAQLSERLRSICISNNINCAFTINNDINKDNAQSKFGNEATMAAYRLVLDYTTKPRSQERKLNNLNIDINKNGLQFL